MTSVMCGRSEATIPGTEGGEGAGGRPAGCCSQRDRLSSRLAIHNSISREENGYSTPSRDHPPGRPRARRRPSRQLQRQFQYWSPLSLFPAIEI